MTVSPYIAVLIVLYFLPLGMYSPCIREKGTLGPKPLLIGHRGSPMVSIPQWGLYNLEDGRLSCSRCKVYVISSHLRPSIRHRFCNIYPSSQSCIQILLNSVNILLTDTPLTAKLSLYNLLYPVVLHFGEIILSFY